jgi:hypothetical protein
MKRSLSPRCLAATFAAGAIALVCPPAAGAHAVTIPDPGSPGGTSATSSGSRSTTRHR